MTDNTKKKMARKMTPNFKGVDKLEKHKATGASLDNGTWKPSKSGESFIDALNNHKRDSERYK